MAKWGEGDPRWLVEHREDGKNVNAWHWTESSKLSWCRQRLEQLLPAVAAPVAPASIVVKTVKSVTGEATVTVRKGNRKLVLFDLGITCSWQGQLADSEKIVEGEWKIEEFSSGNEEDDYVYTVTVTGSGPEQDELKKLAEGALTPSLMPHLRQFIQDLNEL